MVTRGGVSTRENARKGREMLEKVGARVIGVAVWGLEGDGSGTAYGYGGYYYGSYTPTEHRRSKKGQLDSGAKGFAATADSPSADFFTPEKSTGRRIAEFIGGVMAALLGFLVVLTLIAVVVYFADQAFGWGLGIAGVDLATAWSLSVSQFYLIPTPTRSGGAPRRCTDRSGCAQGHWFGSVCLAKIRFRAMV